MAYAIGGIDPDAGTGAVTLRSTSGVAALGEEGVWAITGAVRAGAIVEDSAPGVLLSLAVDVSCLRAMLIGIEANVEVDRVAEGRVGFDVRLRTDASGVCWTRGVIVESALRMTTAGPEAVIVDAAARLTKGDVVFSTP